MQTPDEGNPPELPKLSEMIPTLAQMEKEHWEFIEKAIPPERKVEDAEAHLVVAVLRRSRDNIMGFLAMADQKNVFCGMPIVRFQIDTAMALFARTLVSDVEDFFKHIAEGKRLSDFKSASGDKLTDAFLHKKLSKKHAMMSDLYKDTSGYVHFSTQHIHRVLDLDYYNKTKQVRFGNPEEITAGWGDEELRGAMVCFLWATEGILDQCKEWLSGLKDS